MNQPELYFIARVAEGKVYMMPKPSAENLQADIEFYASQGIDAVVSLLRDVEIEAQGLKKQPDLCQQTGIDFYHFPIKDMDVPDKDQLKAFLKTLQPLIEAGKSIAFHCHGGRGRAGTAVISLMLENGYQAEQAIAIASKGRQDKVPVCEVQTEFLIKYL